MEQRLLNSEEWFGIPQFPPSILFLALHIQGGTLVVKMRGEQKMESKDPMGCSQILSIWLGKLPLLKVGQEANGIDQFF